MGQKEKFLFIWVSKVGSNFWFVPYLAIAMPLVSIYKKGQCTDLIFQLSTLLSVIFEPNIQKLEACFWFNTRRFLAKDPQGYIGGQPAGWLWFFFITETYLTTFVNNFFHLTNFWFNPADTTFVDWGSSFFVTNIRRTDGHTDVLVEIVMLIWNRFFEAWK